MSIEIIAKKRTETGKQANRRLNAENMIPAVMYGHKGVTLLSLDENATRHSLEKIENPHQLVTVIVEGDNGEKSEHKVLLKEIQRHVYKDQLFHIDFNEVNPDKEMIVKVPLELQGHAKGVKLGGTIQMVMRKIPVKCKPENIPSSLPLDVSDMELNSYMRVKEVPMPEAVTLAAKQDFTILTLRGRLKVAATPAAE